MSVNLAPVKSSNVQAVGYDQQTGDLHVQFKGGGTTYVYHGVPADLHTKVMKAESIGSFLHSNVRDKFKFTKMEPKPQA